MLYSSGGHYAGSFKNDMREGMGLMIYPTGEKYKGEWKNDERTQ